MKLRQKGILRIPALLLLSAVLVISGPWPVVVEAAVLPPSEVDVALTGFQQGGTRRNGIRLSDQLKYRLTVSNAGTTAVPVGGVVLIVSAEPLGPGSGAGFVVTAISGGDFDTTGGSCQVGAADTARCVNATEIPPGGEVRLTIAYRHNRAVAGELALFAGVSPNRSSFIDPVSANNTFVGPAYAFDPSLVAPEETVPVTTVPDATTVPTTTIVTTTTADPETTVTTADPETTLDPEGTETTADPAPSTTVTPSETTVTPSETTVTPSETTVTPSETTVDPAGDTTTVTTVADDTTTLPAPTETLDLTGDEASPAAPNAADPTLVSGEQAEDPSGESSESGANTWLVTVGFLALSVALGGGLLIYQRYNREDPPLVDIRHYR